MNNELLDKAKQLINANHISTILGTVDSEYNVNMAVMNFLEFIGDDIILCARFGANRTYHNLLQTSKGTFMVLQVDQEKATKDGIRISVQLTEALTEGDYFERMAEKLAASSYSSFPLKHCLVFKVIDILPITFMQKK